MSEILVHVTRGSHIESRHHGDLVIVNGNGKILYAVGDPRRFTFWRSAAKPFQAIPFLESGGMEAFHIQPHELALMTSSHGGEPAHVDTILSILSKIGYDNTYLDCGIAAPMYSPAADTILRGGHTYQSTHNACSGKHASMLALGKLLGFSMENYLHADHPIQQIMKKTIAACCDMCPQDVVLAVDGCGVPVFGMGIDRMALAYARFSKPENYFEPVRADVLKEIRSAMTGNPFYVAGTNRLDTILMEVTKGRLVAKLGAEAVYNIGVVDEDLGICLKIDDGSYRAIDPVIIDVLNSLDLISKDEFQQLRSLWKPVVKNHRGEIIGELQPVFKLNKF